MNKIHRLIPLSITALLLVLVSCTPPNETQPAPASTVPPAATVTPSPIPASPTSLPEIRGLPEHTLPDGLGVAIHYEFFPDTYMPLSEYVLMKEVNIGFVRDDMWPGGACAVPPWCFEYFDRLVENMAKIGVRVVFNLQDYENTEIGTEEGRRKFAEFAGDAAERFKGQGVVWEIWNEPDLDVYWKPHSDPLEYALLVEETAQAIREADPNAVIIGPSVATLSTVFGDNSWRFLETIGAEGVFEHFDAVDVHLYNGGNPESQIENLRKLRRLVDSHSPQRRIPITSTEWGYTTGGEYYRHRSPPEEQPKYLVRSFLVKASHEIRLSIWYDWKNDDWDPNGEAERHFGVITSSGEPKPAYDALQTLTTTLDGYQFVRRIAAGTGHDYLLLFRKGDSGVLAAWTITEPRALLIPNVSGEVESIDMFGEGQMLQAGEEGLSLLLSDSPQYLILKDGFFGSEGVYWMPNGTFFRIDDGGQGEISITIENPSNQVQTSTFQAFLNDTPAGELETVLQPKEKRVVLLPVNIKLDPGLLDYLLKITVSSEDVLQSAWVWVQR